MARNSEVGPAELTIREAADLLGVSLPTLRRWDEAGKFKAHPMNGYRLCARAEVLRLRKRIVSGRAA